LSRIKKLIASIKQNDEHNIALNLEFVSNNQNKDDLIYFTESLRIRKEKFSISISNKNAGFSEMNNLVFDRYLKMMPDFFLLINDDVWLDKDFFNKFINSKKSKLIDIVTPLVVDATILKSQRRVRIDSYGVEYFKSGYAKNSTSIEQETQLTTASCVLISSSVVKKLITKYGFVFNELLFFYLEDVELFIRARMIGAKISKNSEMIAYHWGSSTSGKKSYFTMYQTYRNILWVILMTWPLGFIIRNFLNVFLVQGWVFIYSIKSFGIKMYLKIIFDTFMSLPKLLQKRKKIIKSYENQQYFGKIFSDLSFRTYHGIKIKAL
jgi:GT2 family glycosyltransferase